MSARVAWIDATRGIGIILVVFGHVWRGLDGAGIIKDAQLFGAVDAAIYVFHMPLFFLISGLFFEKSVIRDGIFPSLWRRTETLLYPLLLWSWITAAFLITAGSLTNRPPISALDALLYPFPPKDVYWFFWALFLIQTLTSVLVGARTAFLVLLFAASLTLLMAFGIAPYPFLIRGTVENLPFFVLGVLLARSGRFPLVAGSATGPIAAVILTACLAWVASNPGIIGTAPAYLAATVATLTFCAVVAWACALVPQRVMAPLSLLGVASIAIFVSHVIPLAATRIVLEKTGVSALPVHLILGTLAGLLPGALGYFALRKLGYLRWFGLGRDEPRRPTTPQVEQTAIS